MKKVYRAKRGLFKALALILVISVVLPTMVGAANWKVISNKLQATITVEDLSQYEAKIGTTYYTTLAEAVAAAPQEATETTTIELLKDVLLTSTLRIENEKNITLNLNGKTISAGSTPLRVEHATLNVTGKGVIQETENDKYAPILIKGSPTDKGANYTNVTVGAGVTLKGWAGLFIDKYSNDNKNAYGVHVDFAGTIVSPAYSSHTATGSGIYINGSIQHTNNCPVINIRDGASITVGNDGTAIYAAGYTQMSIGKANIEGTTAVEVKAGNVTIDGATLVSYGEEIHAPNNNGGSTEGFALAVVDNPGYGEPLNVTVESLTQVTGRIALLSDRTGGAPVDTNKVTFVFDFDPSAYLIEGIGAKHEEGKFNVYELGTDAISLTWNNAVETGNTLQLNNVVQGEKAEVSFTATNSAFEKINNVSFVLKVKDASGNEVTNVTVNDGSITSKTDNGIYWVIGTADIVKGTPINKTFTVSFGDYGNYTLEIVAVQVKG